MVGSCATSRAATGDTRATYYGSAAPQGSPSTSTKPALLISTYYSLLTHSRITTHTHHSLLTTHHYSLTTHYRTTYYYDVLLRRTTTTYYYDVLLSRLVKHLDPNHLLLIGSEGATPFKDAGIDVMQDPTTMPLY